MQSDFASAVMISAEMRREDYLAIGDDDLQAHPHLMKFILLCAPCLLMTGLSLPGQEIALEKLDPNMTLEKADSKGISWFDPRAVPFRLVGFPWITEDQVYRRLPVKPQWPLRAAVDIHGRRADSVPVR